MDETLTFTEFLTDILTQYKLASEHLEPSNPHPRGSVLSCTVHVKYMQSTKLGLGARTPEPITGDPLSKKPLFKVTQVQRHFSAKKKFNDSDGAREPTQTRKKRFRK